MAAFEHVAFFDALASLPDDAQATPAYRQIVAGLLTLRLLDRWARSTVGGPARTRVLIDLANALATIGRRAAARDALHLFAGEGQYRFGRVDAARASLAAAVGLAERHQLLEFVIRAEAALAMLDRRQRLPSRPTPPAPSAPAVARVVDRLRAMSAPA